MVTVMLMPRLLCAIALSCAGVALFLTANRAGAEDDARMKQLRLLCVRLSGDLTDPGGMAAFRRCLTTHNPLNEIRRDNNIAAPVDRPSAAPPEGFGGNTRFHVADGIERFFVAEANLVYVLDKAGKLWRGTVDGKDARLVEQNVAAFQISDGRLFVQNADGVLWRVKPDGTERTRIDQTVAAFQPINAGLIYVLGTDHTLWREIGDTAKRSEVDHTVKEFQAVDGNVVFVLGADGQLWREAGSAQSRSLVAKDVTAFQFLPGSEVVYVHAVDGTLWRKHGNDKPEQVDQSVAAFQAMDASVSFVLGKDGRLWREIGGRQRASLVDRDVLVSAGKAAFQATDPSQVFVLGNDHRLWLEAMPGGQ
jgi:hypothetical protein